MTDPEPSLFSTDGDAFVATGYARGPWDPSSCHGGPVSALLTRACERLGADDGAAATWHPARITVELVRPVPVGTPLFLTTVLERPGRNVSLVGAVITVESGTEVARARALRVRDAAVELPDSFDPEPPFSEAGAGVLAPTTWASDQIAFHRDSVELRYTEGTFTDPGPVSLWCRLVHPLLLGEAPTGPQRAAAAADFSNGVSSELDPAEMIYINPDLSVHLLRTPEGEWIGMHARSHYGQRGAGLAEAALYDERGRCGRSVQTLFLSRR